MRSFVKPTNFDKMNKQQFLTRELKENPEFFKAFPHLSKGITKKAIDEQLEEQMSNNMSDV